MRSVIDKFRNNVNEVVRVNIKQQQQKYSKCVRLQLMQGYLIEFSRLNTYRVLKSEPVELKTKKKQLRWPVILFTVQQVTLKLVLISVQLLEITMQRDAILTM